MYSVSLIRTRYVLQGAIVKKSHDVSLNPYHGIYFYLYTPDMILITMYPRSSKQNNRVDQIDRMICGH